MLRRLPWLLFAAAVSAACAASLLSIWAEDAWLADLAVNFRLQYLAIALLAVPVLLWRRSLPLAAATLATIVLNAAPVYAYFQAAGGSADDAATRSASASASASASTSTSVPASVSAPAPVPLAATLGPAGRVHPATIEAAAPSSAGRVPLRIASANVLFLNSDYAAVTAWARRTRPDVLLFLEATAAWRSGLAPLEAEYPYVQYVTDRSHHGLLLLSHWPLTDVVTRPATARQMRPVVFSTLTKDGARLRLAAMHATWPMHPSIARQRQRDLDALAAEASRRGPLPFVGVGDFNISPFSPHYQATLRAGGLRNAAAGHGWQPTWPAMFLPLGIQIDHALVSPEVEVQAFHRGSPNGSDHMPIIVDVLIPRITG